MIETTIFSFLCYFAVFFKKHTIRNVLQEIGLPDLEFDGYQKQYNLVTPVFHKAHWSAFLHKNPEIHMYFWINNIIRCKLSDPIHRADELLVGEDASTGEVVADDSNRREDGRPRWTEFNGSPCLIT